MHRFLDSFIDIISLSFSLRNYLDFAEIKTKIQGSWEILQDLQRGTRRTGVADFLVSCLLKLSSSHLNRTGHGPFLSFCSAGSSSSFIFSFKKKHLYFLLSFCFSPPRSQGPLSLALPAPLQSQSLCDCLLAEALLGKAALLIFGLCSIGSFILRGAETGLDPMKSWGFMAVIHVELRKIGIS